MKREDVKNWLTYWANAKLVSVAEIQTLADVALARKFCRVMSVGRFAGVADREIWSALEEMRADAAQTELARRA